MRVLRLIVGTVIGGALGWWAYSIIYADQISMMSEAIPGSVRMLTQLTLEEAEHQYLTVGYVSGFIVGVLGFFDNRD